VLAARAGSKHLALMQDSASVATRHAPAVGTVGSGPASTAGRRGEVGACCVAGAACEIDMAGAFPEGKLGSTGRGEPHAQARAPAASETHGFVAIVEAIARAAAAGLS
jgi:hypothetical protein